MLQDIVPHPLKDWESFYVIVGSAGAALTGLQFVVIALVSDTRQPTNTGTLGAFATPTIVHFCSVLLMSAVLSAPWQSLAGAAWPLGAAGLAGVIYATIVTRRARRQAGYTPVLEDWVFHSILPFVAYALLLAGALLLGRETTDALFMIATTSLLLLFIGIHNAWDTVTYIVVERLGKPEAAAGGTPVAAPPAASLAPPVPPPVLPAAPQGTPHVAPPPAPAAPDAPAGPPPSAEERALVAPPRTDHVRK